jgi:hypothetical protein
MVAGRGVWFTGRDERPMSLHQHEITCACAALALAALTACGTTDDGRGGDEDVALTGISAEGTTNSTGESVGATSLASTTDGEDTTGGGLKLDVGPPEPTTGGACPADDACCTMKIPPHELLDEFLLAYPPANMPKSVAAIQAFMPQANGHMMAWSDENVGNEIIDPDNGGVIAANIEAGRDISRAAAFGAIPGGGVMLEMRDDPVIIEVLAGAEPCNAVGWGWGSILFQDVDESVGEVVYLYIGYCAEPDGDVEVFYYSDQSVQICEPPA